MTEERNIALESIEITLCAKDPIYFINTYCKLRHPIRGKIPFKLYPYQEKALLEFEANRKNVLLKSRQMGFSWLIGAYSIWKALFSIESDILLMSKKEDDAKEILHKVKFLYLNLPKYLKLNKVVDSASILSFKNGSRIISLPATESSGRGFAGTLVVLDEAAFVPWGEIVYGALRPTLSTGGSIILQSTAPNSGGENLFARILEDYKENGFHRITGSNKASLAKLMVHWSECPDRDEKWFESERPGYTERQWATEFEGDLLQSSRRVFPEDILKLHTTEEYKEGHEIKVRKTEWKKGPHEEMYCEEPEEGETYAVGVDVAEGLEKGDYTVATILKKSTGKQVLVYRTRIPAINATENIVEIARRYNNALLAIEDNNVGIIAVQIAKRTYKNLFRRKIHDKISDTFTEKIGWRTTKRTKPLMIRDLELALRDQDILMTDKTTRREAWQYQYDEKGNTACPEGTEYFDDCLIAFAIAWQALKQISSPDAILKYKVVKAKRKRGRKGRQIRNASIGY